jgi:hypothetical protein
MGDGVEEDGYGEAGEEEGDEDREEGDGREEEEKVDDEGGIGVKFKGDELVEPTFRGVFSENSMDILKEMEFQKIKFEEKEKRGRRGKPEREESDNEER